MTWLLLFCAWGMKAGGCVTPVQFTSKRACEFALRHQIAVARQPAREWSDWRGMIADGRCIGVRT